MKARIECDEPADSMFDGSMADAPVMLAVAADLFGSGTVRDSLRAGCPCLAVRESTAGTVLHFAGGASLAWAASFKGKLRRLRKGESVRVGPGIGEMALEGSEGEAAYPCDLMPAGAWAMVAESANAAFVPGEPIMRLVPGGGWTNAQSKAYMNASGMAMPNVAGVRVRNLRKGERVVIDP